MVSVKRKSHPYRGRVAEVRFLPSASLQHSITPAVFGLDFEEVLEVLELGLEDSAGGAGAFDSTEAPDAVVLLLVQLSSKPVETGLCMGLEELMK